MATNRTLAQVSPDVAAEWHPSKNGDLRPTDVSPYSHKKVWWLGKCGHEFNSEVAKRMVGRGCRYCSGQAVLKGFNDLETTRPDVAAEWHPNLNAPLLPSEVTSGSTAKKVWWLGKCGHHWQSTPESRCRGTGCNVCASKVVVIGINDMATTHPVLAMEFDYQLNSPLKPIGVVAGTNTKLHWICPVGHKYVTSGNKRTLRGYGCPICSRRQLLAGDNDLATTHPQLAVFWGESNPETSSSLTAGSSKKVFWKCPYGHQEYLAAVKNRMRGQGCPVCQNKTVQKGVTDLATIFPSLALEWDSKINHSRPDEVAPYSHKKFWWTCESHGSYQATVAHRSNGRGCPGCSSSGFDPSKPGIFYFIEHEKLGAKKFGITNASSREDRLKGFRNLGWKVLLQVESPNGSEIAALEKAIFTWVRKELSLPVYLSRQDIGKIGGWTETLSADGLDNRVGIAKVNAELERLRNLQT